MYMHLPSLPRCVAGMNILESLHSIESAGLKTERTASKVKEMPENLLLHRPQQMAAYVGVGGLGVYADTSEK